MHYVVGVAKQEMLIDLLEVKWIYTNRYELFKFNLKLKKRKKKYHLIGNCKC